MAAFRRVRPTRAAAWEAGSEGPRYASTSTMTPSALLPSTVDTRRLPRSSGATSSAGRAKKRSLGASFEGGSAHHVFS